MVFTIRNKDIPRYQRIVYFGVHGSSNDGIIVEIILVEANLVTVEGKSVLSNILKLLMGGKVPFSVVR